MDLTLVNLVNKAYEREKRKAEAIKYSRSCRRKEIKYYLMLIFILLGIGLVGTLELHAEPDYVREQQAKEIENYYPTTGIVTAVGEDFMVFTNFNGHCWEKKGDVQDWDCGDICSAIMDSKGTELIEDDEIVEIQYSGWIY